MSNQIQVKNIDNNEGIIEALEISDEEMVEHMIKCKNFMNPDADSPPISLAFVSDAIEKLKDKVRLGETITIHDINDLEGEWALLWQ